MFTSKIVCAQWLHLKPRAARTALVPRLLIEVGQVTTHSIVYVPSQISRHKRFGLIEQLNQKRLRQQFSSDNRDQVSVTA